MIELDYKTFKKDCKQIIEPVVEKYSYVHDDKKSEDYINYYFNGNGCIEVSMLENFPHIGVSINYLTLSGESIKPSVLNKYLQINQVEKSNFYKEFKSKFDLNDYANEMHYAVAIMEKFYKPILNGEIKLEDILKNESNR